MELDEVWAAAREDFVHLKASTGEEIYCTEDTLLLTEDGYKEAKTFCLTHARKADSINVYIMKNGVLLKAKVMTGWTHGFDIGYGMSVKSEFPFVANGFLVKSVK